MNRILLVFFLAATLSVQAQLNYTLSTSTAAYSELSGATDISNDAWNSMYQTTTPFTFTFFGNPYNKIYVTYDGFFFSDSGDDYVFYGTDNFMPENGNTALSPISYQVTGAAPDRILKVQWKNVREFTVDTASYEYYLNNQIWLYENGSKIEYHFGPNSISDPNFNAFYIGIIDLDNSPYLAIDSSAASPVLVRVMNAGTFDGIPSYPQNGQVYTLTPYSVPVGIAETSKPYRFTCRGNHIEIQGETAFRAEVLDMNGRSILVSAAEAGTGLKQDLSGLTPGIYLLNVGIGKRVFTEKITIR